MPVLRFEAIGQRGEACIIIGRQVSLDSDAAPVSYFLASGERLIEGEEAGCFSTLDGRRTFRLRHPTAPSQHESRRFPSTD